MPYLSLERDQVLIFTAIQFVKILVSEVYDKVKADTQILKFLAGMMSKESSLHFNDEFGELSQQFALGGKRKTWVMKCLNLLAKIYEF